jgi:serine/threonine protein kinase
MVNAQGHLWITDFGLAMIHGDHELTMSDVVGTLRHMSPEQVRGARAMDYPSDIYVLGVTLMNCSRCSRPSPARTGKS